MDRVLTVQTVLYRERLEAVMASVGSLGGALGAVRRAGMVGDVVLAHGDAGPQPLEPHVVEALESLAARGGFSYQYRFFGENTGSALGQNRLAEQFPATWQFVTNPDVVFGGTCLARLWERAGEPDVGILEARQLPLELARSYDPESGHTSWGSGACSMVRGDLWRRIGGYDDEHFFLHGDDVDMSWRIRLEGFHVVHVPTARVFHDKRIDEDNGGREVSDSELYYSAIGSFMMATKWGTEVDRERVQRNMEGEIYAEARAELKRRARKGKLPNAISGAEKVATFTQSGAFGEWRYET